jgi:hypothetical protein
MKTFAQKCADAGIRMLPISKSEREGLVYPVIHKFTHGGVNYRINKSDDDYIFCATKFKSRYYHAVKIFKTLAEAENFIFTSECP